MITLEQLLERLVDLKPGETGRVTGAELAGIDVPEIAAMDVKARAEWLRRKLSFPYDIRESATTGDWAFSRLSN